MTKAVAVMSDGHPVYFEVEQVQVEVVSSEGLADAPSSLIDKMEHINNTILSVCRSVHEKAYNALATGKPKEFELEFGVTLAGEAGIPLVSKGSAEAQLKVTARW